MGMLEGWHAIAATVRVLLLVPPCEIFGEADVTGEVRESGDDARTRCAIRLRWCAGLDLLRDVDR